MRDVLVIEDDKIFATVHTHMVRKTLAFDPKVFEKAEEAVEYLDYGREKRDRCLILLDLNMSGMNGWEFLDAISKKDYKDDILVLIVTSSLFWEDQKRSQNYQQVIAYLTKPMKMEQFRELVNDKTPGGEKKDKFLIFFSRS